MFNNKQRFLFNSFVMLGVVTHAINAHAENNAQIVYHFNVLPTTCNITVDKPTFELGYISTKQLPDSGPPVPIASVSNRTFKPANFTVKCGGPITIGFKVTDGAAGGVDADAPSGAFGLGLGYAPTKSVADAPIGYYTLVPNAWKAENVPVNGDLQERLLSTDAWTNSAANEIFANTKMYTLSSLVDTPSKVVDFQLTPKLFLNPKTKLDPAKTHLIDGAYTVTLVF